MFLRSRWFVAAVFAVLATGMLIPAVYLLAQGRNNAEILILPPSEAGSEGKAAAAGGEPPGAPIPEDIQVYVHGAVKSPGVYELLPGARIADAVEAAGGTGPEADLAAINLARRIVDEGYYYVPKVGETPPRASREGPQSGPSDDSRAGLPGSGTGTSGQGLVNLNAATKEELVTLPGIGQVRAQSIVDHREQHGPFPNTEAITDVHGIGQGIYQQVRELVTVGGDQD